MAATVTTTQLIRDGAVTAKVTDRVIEGVWLAHPAGAFTTITEIETLADSLHTVAELIRKAMGEGPC